MRSQELLNAFGFTTLFGVLGWLGTWTTWIGLALLFLHMSNGIFHLVSPVTRMSHLPGTVTGILLYAPLALLATRHASGRTTPSSPSCSRRSSWA